MHSHHHQQQQQQQQQMQQLQQQHVPQHQQQQQFQNTCNFFLNIFLKKIPIQFFFSRSEKTFSDLQKTLNHENIRE